MEFNNVIFVISERRLKKRRGGEGMVDDFRAIAKLILQREGGGKKVRNCRDLY